MSDVFRARIPPGLALKGAVSALLAYVLLTLWVFRGTALNLQGSLLGPPEDNLQDLWNTWYYLKHVGSYRDVLGTALIRFPEGTQLYYHSFAYPKVFLAWMLGEGLVGSVERLVALHNLLLLMSPPLAGVGTFLLLRRFGLGWLAAFAGGAVFAFSPSHVEHLQHHMHVSTVEFIPFFALFFMIAYERRSAVALGLSVLCYILSTLSCWYYLFYCAYFMAFYAAYQAMRQRAWPSPRQLGVVALHLVALVVLLSPLLVPMVAATATKANVYAAGARVFVADIAGYVTFPPQHLFGTGMLSRAIYWRLPGNDWEKTVYLGLGNLALLGWLLTRRGIEPRDVRLFVISGMLVFMAFASGDWLNLVGTELVPMPSLLLSKLPFFGNVRTPSRAIVFTYLFLAIGVGVAIDAMLRAVRGRTGGGVLAALVLAILALDWYPARPEASPFACPAGYEVVRADPDPDFAVLDLPLRYVDLNAAMAYQPCHGRPIVGGVVSREPVPTLRDRVALPEPAAQRVILAQNKVKYIFFHRENGPLFRRIADGPDEAAYRRAYRIVYDGPDGVLLQVYD